MSIRAIAPALIAPIAAAALLAGCGSADKIAAASSALTPTATKIGSGTPPVAGSMATQGAKRLQTVATGKRDRAGGFCSGRDQARYAGERLMCVTGRLERAK